ncbi:MAG: arabinose efflux permease family protein [Acidobacteria bacterium]|nr:arabinose efflux permease family protein [Acidobacteriota bacterium]
MTSVAISAREPAHRLSPAMGLLRALRALAPTDAVDGVAESRGEVPGLDPSMQQRRVLATLFAIVFADLVGFGIVIPLLPLYAEQYAPPGWAFGLLMASYSAMQFLFAPVLGRLSDRVGRRPVLLISLVGSVAGFVLFALADSLALLFASRLLAGACGGNVGIAQAVIADVTPREQRARGMGMIGAAFGLGFIRRSASASSPGRRWPACCCRSARRRRAGRRRRARRWRSR